jgi:tungstate transport system permease protein
MLAPVMAALGGAISETGPAMIVAGTPRCSTRVLTTATVLETGKANFDIAIALSVILLRITSLVTWALTRIQQRGPRDLPLPTGERAG